MSLLAQFIYWLLQAYFFALIGRFILDLILTTNPSWRPKGLFLVLAEVVMTITDPPLRWIRRIVPPLRFGVIALDLAWTILISAVLFTQGLVAAFI
jgi:YggT family protein